jgi:hypothetical protein
MDHRGQDQPGLAQVKDATLRFEKKTAGITGQFDRLFDRTRLAFAQERTFERARILALSSLVGLGRKTVSGMLCASAQQFRDWSAAYRLFEKERFNVDALFDPIRREVVKRQEPGDPLVVMMDDTLVRKRGKKVHGAKWYRDPLGPPFSTNFVWGQRFVQISAALPEGMGRARAVPIDLAHAPLPLKPCAKASEQQWTQYREKQKTMKLGCLGAKRIGELRTRLDEQGHATMRVIVAMDGSFTNRALLRNLPHDTVAIGRIRKDARLFLPPVEQIGPKRGRRRWYGDPLPTPEDIRQDEAIPWISVQAFAAGKTHTFEVKTVGPVRWLGTGRQDGRVVVIRPIAYRPRKGCRLLYRNPAYLICTDPELPLDRLIQSYLWRWEIELNFRDEKTTLGMGEAQVRIPAAVETVPALIVAAYAFLLLAGSQKSSSSLPEPKWRASHPSPRASTAKLIGMFRSELWGRAMGLNLTHFVNGRKHGANVDFFENSLPSAVCYAVK